MCPSTSVMQAPAEAHPFFRTVHAPQPLPTDLSAPQRSIFLSGSIDQGKAVDWQSLTTSLSSHALTILNPRRPDWDSTWTQDPAFAPFREQIEWELAMMEHADVIAVYFAKDSLAPITLMELGLFAKSGKCVVACPEGFWRRGNVQIVCERYGIECLGSMEELKVAVERKLEAVKARA